MEATIFVHDDGHHSYMKGYFEIKYNQMPTVRSMHYVEITEETHNSIMSILDNRMILTANLRAILANQS